MDFDMLLMIAATQGGGAVVLTPGPELWPQPTFAASTGLTLTRCSIATNTLSYDHSDLVGNCTVTTPPAFVAGEQYQYSVTLSANAQGDGLSIQVGGAAAAIGGAIGTKTGILVIPGSPTAIMTLKNNDNFSPGTAQITACSIKKLS